MEKKRPSWNQQSIILQKRFVGKKDRKKKKEKGVG